MTDETFADPTADDQYWYNTDTGEVERGRLTPAPERLGPFATADEAARAPEIVKERAKAWADDDEAEDTW